MRIEEGVLEKKRIEILELEILSTLKKSMQHDAYTQVPLHHRQRCDNFNLACMDNNKSEGTMALTSGQPIQSPLGILDKYTVIEVHVSVYAVL